MRNLHQIILQEYGLEARHLFRDWERLHLRASNYKNHRIFTLRCLHKELIPVSIKLKSTLKTERAKRIIRKAEKDLPQARVKAINSILDNVAKQTELCRSQLASILSAQRLRQCQGFIENVGEIRFTKVKQRQLNKFNNLLNKKEGNITRANSSNSPNLASQAVRQAGAHLPPEEGSNLMTQATQSGRQAGTHLPPREGSNLMAQATQSGRQSGAHLPQGEGGSLSQASQASQAVASQPGVHLPPGEGSNLVEQVSQAGRQAGTHLPLGEGGSLSQQAVRLPRPPRQLLPSQALTFPLGKEAT